VEYAEHKYGFYYLRAIRVIVETFLTPSPRDILSSKINEFQE